MCKFCKNIKFPTIGERPKTWLVVIGIAVVLIYCFAAYFGGDDFAAGLVSALALAFVVAGLFIQREELILQRKELSNTRKELKGQKEEAAKQNQILRLRQFEYDFFNLKNDLDNELIRINIDCHNDIFEYCYLEQKNSEDYYMNKGLKDYLFLYGIKKYKKSVTYILFRIYFRKLYRFIKFIDESKLLTTDIEKYYYISLVRDSMSEYQLIVMFYHVGSNCDDYCEEFKLLIEKYEMFKHIKIEFLKKAYYDKRRTKISPNFYASNAFGDTALLTKIEAELNIPSQQ